MIKDYIIITGAYGGLGKALSLSYAKQGYGLVLLGRNKLALKQQKEALSQHTKVITEICDIRDWESCQEVYKKTIKTGIKIKILINNAGITYIHLFDKDFDILQYQQVINTNLNGYVYMSKLFLEDLIDNKGTIINISSVLGYAPLIGRTAYTASKFGLEGFFSVLQTELTKKLHIMMVYPTFIETNIRENSNISIDQYIILTPEKVTKKIIKAHKRKARKVYIGKTAKIAYYIYKYLPKLYIKLMKRNTEIKQ